MSLKQVTKTHAQSIPKQGIQGPFLHVLLEEPRCLSLLQVALILNNMQ